MKLMKYIILLLLVSVWGLSSSLAQTSGGGPFTHSSGLNITDGTTSAFPYKLTVSPGSLSCSGGTCTLTTGAGGVTSVSNSDGSITVSPTTGDVILSNAGYWKLSSSNLYAPIADTVTTGALTTSYDTFTVNDTSSSGGGETINSSPSGISATGGTITFSGGRTIHTFTTGGTFTVTGSGNVQLLVIGGAGGGAGGSGNTNGTGGGGAGEYYYNATYAVTSQGYTVTVGNGGNGGAAGADSGGGNNGLVGGSSSFGTITVNGGGYGSLPGGGVPGGAGGSGGGGGNNQAGGASTASVGVGNAGGTGLSSTPFRGGGGGGSGGAGASGSASGNGGAGTSNSITGSAVTYACGGGGGTYHTATAGAAGCANGGAGGAGNGTNAGGAGAANKGSGGGGGSSPDSGTGGAGGNGGSGVVIISYPTSGAFPWLRLYASGSQTAKWWTDGTNGNRATTTVGSTDVETQTTTNTTLNTSLTLSTQNIITDTSIGTDFATGTTQKIGFYGLTPIVQPGATTDLGTVLSNLGLRVSGTAYPITTSGTTNLSGTNTINGYATTAKAVSYLSYQPGLLTAVNATIGVYAKVSNASTVDNLIGSAVTFSCVANPTITMYECGTSTTCASTPVTIGTVTVTAAGTATVGTVSNPAITAGDYIGFAMTAGTCASIDIAANAQLHSN